jgi:1,2-phenylacetyl-CoA epoxidase catalytic subunit
VAAALLRWGLALADSKQALGLRAAEWVTRAPALEAAVAAAAIAQDELGHARSLFAVLKELPDAPPAIGAENDRQARATFFWPAVLAEPFDSWPAFIAALVLFDQALLITVETLAGSAFAPLRGRWAKIAQEEVSHRIYGQSWLGRLAAWPEQRTTLDAALRRYWPVALAWLGPDDDPDISLLAERAILPVRSRDVRQRWLALVEPLLVDHGLPIPRMTLNWGCWEPCRRELVGAAAT